VLSFSAFYKTGTDFASQTQHSTRVLSHGVIDELESELGCDLDLRHEAYTSPGTCIVTGWRPVKPPAMPEATSLPSIEG
jgi:hypothetical protein